MGVITLDAAAAENGLAMMLKELFDDNLARSDRKRRDFDAISSTFAIVSPDADMTVTLSFEHGHCTIYDGLRREPELVITADASKIPELSLISIRYGLPWLLDDHGQAFLKALVRREVRIDGLVRIPPTPLKTAKAMIDLVRLMRVLAIAGAAEVAGDPRVS